LSKTTTIEQNEADFFDVMLNTTAKGIAADPAQIARLYNIGSQCAMIGGPAVYWARTMYGALTQQFLSGYNCSDSQFQGNPADRNALISNNQVATFYPNPTSDLLNIDIQGNDAAYELTIYNIVGKEVQKALVQSGRQQISISGLEQGIYFIAVFQNGKPVQTSKIIKF
jgi:Secretion system C-terminal sorting domain